MIRMRKKPYGLTLVEAILLLVIVSIVAVAAGVGLQAVVKVPAKTDDMMLVNNTLVSVMEQMKAKLSTNWPSTSATTSYTLTLPNTNESTGSSSYALSFPAMSATDGVAWTNGYATTPATGTSTPKPLAVNYKIYQLRVTLEKADPADPVAGTNYRSDFLRVTVQLFVVTGFTASTTATQTMVTYATKP